MVAAIILFMGTVSGAHLNPAVSIGFALRGDFPWRRVPAYVVAQFAGAVLATLLLWALIGKQGSAGLTLPGTGISAATAMLWEVVLTAGLVSVILGTASGAQQIGPLAAIGVGSYIALAGLWGSPVSGASMNPAAALKRATRAHPTPPSGSSSASSVKNAVTSCSGRRTSIWASRRNTRRSAGVNGGWVTERGHSR
jgi:glycerol uptake facilitator-like aquaporin